MNASKTLSAALPDWSLEHDPFGRLMLVRPGRSACEVTPVRAFPIEAPDEGVALVDVFGHEQVWIERLGDLPGPLLAQVSAALSSRDFMPVIESITAVSSVATPSDWTVHTDRGTCLLRLRSEQDIRRLPDKRLLISDADGLHYLIRDPAALDRASRRMLDHFL
ncbi:MAG TPA: DUF1854 domain-containing protein [Pusillimonas sp.]|uniref:cyanophycin metabolism-associated DUF1854 family protein n=1 Tax=Pusillimonas sp. TaxID=3040095 RepID=UPI002C1D5EB7|nr:DUF1854 domain-containing protein [Pusillimonas sp.]HUH88883.1 DUF1854 domain-containing protein [Pusillimonas sp.]